MAILDQEFITDDIPEDDRNFDVVPAGDYMMQVIESELKPTKSGTGSQLVLTLEIMEGAASGRRIWDRLNIQNQNPDAQRIAQRALADLCLAVGIRALRDSEELHFKPFTGRVGIRQDKTGQYGPQNTVRYKARGGQPPAGTGTARQTVNGCSAASQPPRQATAGGGSRPWSR